LSWQPAWDSTDLPPFHRWPYVDWVLSGTMVLENRIFLINGSKIFDTGIGTTQKSVTVSIFASDTRIIVRYYKALPDVWTKSTSGYLIVF
jgi:hypothetical protein